MPDLPRLEDSLWFASSVGYAVVSVRLAGTGLIHVYKGFFLYLVFRVLRSILLRFFHPGSTGYGWSWFYTEPVIWFLFGYATFELSALALRDYRGLASFGRKTLLIALAACVAASVATLVVDISHSKGDFPILLAINLARRAIWSTLTLYLLILAGFLLWFPVPVSRNLLMHTVLLSIYSCANMALLFVRNLFGPTVIPQVSAGIMTVALLCQVGWLFLTRAGETKPATLRPHWRPETERHLLDQLAALNATLARSARGSPSRSGSRM